MEMVEEEQNQQITENLGEDVDRISALPEGLLLEILSRLPYTKEAIKTGTLSKRWEHLWKLAPCLLFDEDEFIYLPTDYVTTVDKTLSQCRQLKLKKFHAHIFYHTEYQSRCKNWLQFAVDCNVEELHINCGGGVEFVLDQYIFTSSCFTDLKLATCVINPTGPISWKNLRSLSISIVKLDEDLIEKMLSGSPLLETLELIDCDGYKRLNVTSKSVKNLVFSSYTDPCVPSLSDFVEIIAPNILSLTIQDYLDLSKLLLLNVSSLVAANLDYRCKYGTKRAEEEEMLKGFIKNLSHVKELKIGVSCSRVLSRLEAKGFVVPSNLRRKS